MNKKSKFIIVFASALLTFGLLSHYLGHPQCMSKTSICQGGHCPFEGTGGK